METTSIAITDVERCSSTRSYFAYCRHLLLDPKDFFRREFSQWTASEALAFGLVAAWLSSLCLFIMNGLSDFAAEQMFRDWYPHLFLGGEEADLGATAVKRLLSQSAWVVAAPFLHLWYMLSASWFLYIFARLLGQDGRKVEFKKILKVTGFAGVGLWFAVIPIFGGLLAYIVSVVLTVTGLAEVFHQSTRRSALIVLLPQALVLMLVVLLVSLLALLAVLWFGTLMAQILEQQAAGGFSLPF